MIDHSKFSKAKPTLSIMEARVLKYLIDTPTRTELAAHALYLEIVSRLYVSTVHGRGLEGLNAPDMGPFHEKLMNHVCRLIDEPEIILSPIAELMVATFTAYKHWNRPDVAM